MRRIRLLCFERMGEVGAGSGDVVLGGGGVRGR